MWKKIGEARIRRQEMTKRGEIYIEAEIET